MIKLEKIYISLKEGGKKIKQTQTNLLNPHYSPKLTTGKILYPWLIKKLNSQPI